VRLERIDATSADVILQTGGRLRARHVIVATNPVTPNLPSWSGRYRHSSHITLTAVAAGLRLAVIGGGLTAAQLAVGACERGARVSMLSRAPLRRANFDADPGWLGQRELGPFLAEPNWSARVHTLRRARQGSMPEAWADRLRQLAGSGALDVRESAVVTASANNELRLGDGGQIAVDEVWAATGWKPAVLSDPLLGPFLRPFETAGGLPILDDHCRVPGTVVHLSGPAAALQVGALAANLAGARIAAERIVGAMTTLPDKQYPHPKERRSR
jgi:cation diffusion facilitator CzcD-associated flavoprotein CzcO